MLKKAETDKTPNSMPGETTTKQTARSAELEELTGRLIQHPERGYSLDEFPKNWFNYPVPIYTTFKTDLKNIFRSSAGKRQHAEKMDSVLDTIMKKVNEDLPENKKVSVVRGKECITLKSASASSADLNAVDAARSAAESVLPAFIQLLDKKLDTFGIKPWYYFPLPSWFY